MTTVQNESRADFLNFKTRTKRAGEKVYGLVRTMFCLITDFEFLNYPANAMGWNDFWNYIYIFNKFDEMFSNSSL